MAPRDRVAGTGQVMLEVGLAMIGFVLLIYLTLKVWLWVVNMIAFRQDAFEQTRLEAGQPDTAGMDVPYEREPIRLLE